MKRIIVLCSILFCAANAQTTTLNAMQTVKDMGLGINLGNTFDSACDWDATSCWISNTVNGYETAWGSPTVTKAMIQGYKNAGIKTVRVPVAWSNMMTGNAMASGQTNGTYTINAEWLNRVQEVVDWILDEDMYAIVNVHWDGGWWKKFPTDSAECMRKYKRIWTQVGERFKDYSTSLIFASLNEEGGWDDIAMARSYNILNSINQEFVTLIRSQGSNNAERLLQIQGYKTNIDNTIDNRFKMPTDSKNHLAVSVHYYDPFAFTHISEPVDWGGIINPMTTWGTPADYNELTGYMNKLKVNFVDKGIPVIIGEYGVASWDAKFARNKASVREYTLAVAKEVYDRNMLPVLWDVQLKPQDGEHQYYYDRPSASFVDPEMVAGFKDITKDYVTPIATPQTVVQSKENVRLYFDGTRIQVQKTLPNGEVKIYYLKGDR